MGVKAEMVWAKVDRRNCILGPELPDISSTAVREALGRLDMEALESMLHPSVAQWCLDNGVYCEPPLGRMASALDALPDRLDVAMESMPHPRVARGCLGNEV